MKPKSPAERKAAERARKRKAGLVRLEEWVTPAERQALKLRLEYMRRKNGNEG